MTRSLLSLTERKPWGPFLKSYCLHLCIKSPPQQHLFSGGVCKLCKKNNSESRRGRERARHWACTCPPLPQPPERLPKAVTESWATQGWGAGHTLPFNDLQMTFTALHFHFPRHRFRGELFVILCQDNGMSLRGQILFSFPRYQSLRTYPLPEKKKIPPKINRTNYY